MNFIKNKLRHFLCFLVIAVFLLITMATDISHFLISSSNTTVAIRDCEAKPPAFGTLEINLLAIDSLSNPIPGVHGQLFITHQKVNSDTCTYTVVFNVTHDFTTDANGLASYTGPDWMHDNSKDLWRVEVRWSLIADVQPDREVQVKFYDQS